MLDWLGLTPVQTQVVGWILIIVAVGCLAGLFWVIITKGKHWKRFERNVKVINACEEELNQLQSEKQNNSRKK